MSSQNLCICPYLARGPLDIFKLRQGHARLGLALNPLGSVSLCEKRNLDRELQGDPINCEDRDWGDAKECQGSPAAITNEEARKDPSLPCAFRACTALLTP